MTTDAHADFTALGDASFASLTTFRRSGDPVATPVWLARSGDVLVVMTAPDSGKVKRIRNDPRVTLRPCNRRGVVADGAPTAAATATVISEPDEVAHDRLALRAKYGFQYRVFGLIERVTARKRKPPVMLHLSAS